MTAEKEKRYSPPDQEGTKIYSGKKTSVIDLVDEKGFLFEAAYKAEYFANTQGGIKRDQTYLSNLDLMLTLDTSRADLWDNGSFFVHVLSNGGGEKLSGAIVGDVQGVSNIEAPRTTRLYQLWYEHLFFDEMLSVLIGIHDYNSEFAVTEYGGLYINSSFGVSKDISGGARPSIFPLAAPAVRLKLTPREQWEFLVGVYDGDPGSPDESEHFPRSDFDKESGFFIGSETAHHFSAGNLPGTFKAGLWVNTAEFNDVIDVDEEGNSIVKKGNYGGYIIVDKALYREGSTDDQGLGAFLQLGAAPAHLNEFDFYAGGGFNYKGLIPNRDHDEAGIAVAHASVSYDLVNVGHRDNAETALEITYKAHINDHLSIQPDVQYIFNPGTANELEDALVVGIRGEISL